MNFNLSTNEFYSVEGFHPAIMAITEQIYKTNLHLPRFTRYYIKQNTLLQNEDFTMQLQNMSIHCIFRDNLEELLIRRTRRIDNSFLDLEKDEIVINAHPICVLNLNVSQRPELSTSKGKPKTNFVVNLGHFKYYLLKSSGLEEYQVPEDLKNKMLINLQFRKEIIDSKMGKKEVSEPIILQIFATSAWNKKELSFFRNICPFITDAEERTMDIIYKSYEESKLYIVYSPFMMLKTPIEFADRKFIEYDGVPTITRVLLSNSDKQMPHFPSTMYFKIQNFYSKDEKSKIFKFIYAILLEMIKITIHTINEIPDGTVYKEIGMSNNCFNTCLRFMLIFQNCKKVSDDYTLDIERSITRELKEEIVSYLEKIFSQLEESIP